MPTSAPSPLETRFILWSGARALLHRGWWLVTSLYLVTVAQLDPSQLVLIGVIQGVASLVFEIPAGVVADTVSRKWALVLSHLLMGAAMLATATVTSFPLLVSTQVLWGISWTFSSGSDIAWITDELDQPDRISLVLTRAARSELAGSAAGIVLLGALAAVTALPTAMTVAGAFMLVLGFYVALRFSERNFAPEVGNRWLASAQILKDGLALVRRSRLILLIFLATFLVNGAAEVGRLYPWRLEQIGFPTLGQPVIWLTALNIVSLLVGVVAIRLVEPRVHSALAAARDYALACAFGAAGLLLLALVPSIWVAFGAVVLMEGVRAPLTRTLAAIQVNQATTDKVRATVLSFLGQAEYLGEIVCGALVALLALQSGAAAFLAAAALLLVTSLLMARAHRP